MAADAIYINKACNLIAPGPGSAATDAGELERDMNVLFFFFLTRAQGTNCDYAV